MISSGTDSSLTGSFKRAVPAMPKLRCWTVAWQGTYTSLQTNPITWLATELPFLTGRVHVHKASAMTTEARTLSVLAVDQDLVRLTGGQLLDSVQRRSVEPAYARALLGEQQVREVAVEEHLHGTTGKCGFRLAVT